MERDRGLCNMVKSEMLISVLVTVYNVEPYLDKCLESVCNQTYRNLEILLIDDGSTDGSEEICDRYAMLDKRIRLVHQENRGSVVARKTGIRIATGKYIVSVDGDDWINADRIENLVHNCVKCDFDMIYMDGIWKEYSTHNFLVKSDVKCTEYEGLRLPLDIFKDMFDMKSCFKTYIRTNMVMWAINTDLLKKQIERENDKIVNGDDLVCIFDCIMEAKSIKLISEEGYHYLQERSNSITNSVQVDFSNQLIETYRNMCEFAESKYMKDSLRQYINYMIVQQILLSDYDVLRKKYDYLFPFMRLKDGGRLVVYGGGKFGKIIKDAVRLFDCYKLCGWIDKYAACCINNNFNQPGKIDILKELQYDYLVIAILDSDIAKAVAKELENYGIEKRKIVCMDIEEVNSFSM